MLSYKSCVRSDWDLATAESSECTGSILTLPACFAYNELLLSHTPLMGSLIRAHRFPSLRTSCLCTVLANVDELINNRNIFKHTSTVILDYFHDARGPSPLQDRVVHAARATQPALSPALGSVQSSEYMLLPFEPGRFAAAGIPVIRGLEYLHAVAKMGPLPWDDIDMACLERVGLE